jgi:hypothetical protein
MGSSTKKGEDCHLQKMMGSSKKTEDSAQIGFNFIGGLPLLL